MATVAIVGAGIAGISCATVLVQAGIPVVLYDKGKGLGGRVATRRAGPHQFDHGAQFVTAQGPDFAAALARLAGDGCAAGWEDGSGRTVTVGMPGMSSLAKHLAKGLDVRSGVQITGMTRDKAGWRLHADGQEDRADRVVVTIPAPQIAPLIGQDHGLVPQLATVRYAPCLTLMAVGAGSAPFLSRRDADDPLAWIAQDSSKPGRPVAEGVAWVAQAGPRFSSDHLEQDMEQVAALMLPMLCDRLGWKPSQIQHAAAHRWRYAAVTAPLGQPFLRNDDATLHLGGDWCLGPRVEAAWDSGTAIARDILDSGV